MNSSLFDGRNDLLLLTYKIFSPICFFLNILAIYLIIFKSTSEMKTYRWHLLIYQLLASALDIFVNFFFQPVAFFPLLAGSGHGFLIENLGFSTSTCICIFINLVCGLSVSVVELFLYRHQCIVQDKLSRIQYCFCVAFYFTVLISLANAILRFSDVPPSQWGELLEKWNPRAMELLKIPNVYYFPYIQNFHIILIIGILVLITVIMSGIFIIGLIWHIHYILWKECKHLSIRTQKMQKKLIIALILQIAVPDILLLTPFVFYSIRVFDSRLGLQILNNIASMMVSNYGILATLFLIYFNEPYREFLLRRLKIKKKIHSVLSLTTLSEIKKTT